MIPLRRKLDLVRGLLTGRKAFGMPLYLNIDPTHRCNLHCAFCRWHSPLLAEPFLDRSIERDLSPELFRQLCANLSGTETRTLQFVGAGEPLLHPEIFGLIATAKEFGFRTLLYSNGILLNADTVRSLISTRLDLLRVTLGETSAERFERKHPRVAPGTFQRILEGLELLTRLKKERRLTVPQLELTVPIDRQVLADLDAVIDMAASAGCDGLFYSVVLDFGQEELKQFCLSPEEVDKLLYLLPRKRRRLARLSIRHNIDTVLLRYRIGREVWRRVPCYAAWYYSFIRSDGRVTVCQRSQAPMGDLGQNPFAEIWNGAPYQDFRRRTLHSSDPPSDCEFCPHVVNSYRIHRSLRPFLPFFRLCGG